MRVLRWLGLALVIAIGLLFALGRPVTWAEAALVMWDVAAGGEPTLWQEITSPPNEHVARWTDGEGDLYAPQSEVRAAMVLVPGAAVMGRDEPRLRALARSLARAGFAVLVPELPEVRRLALSRADADRVASALRQLRRWQPHRPVGVGAVSYAVAPPSSRRCARCRRSSSASAAIATRRRRSVSSRPAPSGRSTIRASSG